MYCNTSAQAPDLRLMDLDHCKCRTPNLYNTFLNDYKEPLDKTHSGHQVTNWLRTDATAAYTPILIGPYNSRPIGH